MLVLLAFQAGFWITFNGLKGREQILMENLHSAFLIVAIILGALAAIPPLPYGSQLVGGAIAFLAAGLLVG